MSRLLVLTTIAATVLTAVPVGTADQATMTRDTFLATRWRVAGPEFSMIPADGFPITFRSDGTVETRNLGGITTWSLDGDELVLSGSHATEIRFKWLADRRVFRYCHLPEKVPLYVFPERVKDFWSIGCRDVRAARLELQIEVGKDAYRSGEPIVVTARLTNEGDAPIFVRRSDDATGYSDGFRVELTKDGELVFQSPAPPQWFEPSLAESLEPGDANSRKLVLNMLGALKPGTYRLKMSYSASYPSGTASIWSEPILLQINEKE